MTTYDDIDGGDEMGITGNVAAGIGPSMEERELYARASIASDLIRHRHTILSADDLVEQADAIWQWVKSGSR